MSESQFEAFIAETIDAILCKANKCSFQATYRVRNRVIAA